jgi:hypothetical protein
MATYVKASTGGVSSGVRDVVGEFSSGGEIEGSYRLAASEDHPKLYGVTHA